MAEGTNRDVVAARIKLETGTVLQSFKNIDTGAKSNADAFKALNAELSTAEKSYKNISSAMDKMALTADQRRQKILAEVEAQHKQKLAQTALLGAKAQQLEQTNRLIDAKMQAQQALIKRRNQQIEQSEREHQQKMQILQNRSVKSGQEAARATGAGTDDRTRERVLQEEQKIRMAITDRQRKEEALREKVLQEEQRIRQALSQTEQQTKRMGSTMDAVSKSFIGRLGDMATHAVVFHTMYKAMHEVTQAMKEGLVDIESNMAGYVQTNEHYFVHFEDGTNKMVMDTQKLNRETKSFIQTAHELGSNILDVTESARLWGRMYKDVNVVQELVRQSTKLSTVDMVELEDATKSMESVMSQYGVHITNANEAMVIGNRVLDSWSKVAHDTMAPARDLGAAFQRTGKIAAETGVSFDVMNGLISAGVRNTALSGENLGNMWKTVLGTIRTDKAVEEIERLGVKTREVVDGVEQWRKAEDILLDLSIQVTDKNYDLTQSYADISRGVYQYAKLAASLNVGDILLGTAASVGSSGSTMQYLTVQMDTIQRKAAQTRTSLLEIFNTAGEDGLRQMIKDVLDGIDQLLIGLTKIPTGVYAAAAGLSGLLLAYKALSGPITSVIAAIQVLNAAKAQETVSTVASTTATAANSAANTVNIVSSEGVTISTVQQTAAREAQAVATTTATVATGALSRAQAAATVTMAAATAGLSLLVGAIAIFAMKSGEAEKAERDRIQMMKDNDSASQQMISQYQRQIDLLPKMVNAHNSLKAMIDGGTLSTSKQEQAKRQLEEISKALAMTIGKEGLAQLEAAGFTDEATQTQIAALNALIDKQREARKAVLEDQKNGLQNQMNENIAAIEKTKEKIESLENSLIAGGMEFMKNIFSFKSVDESSNQLENLRLKLDSLETKNRELEASLSDANVQMQQMTVESIEAQKETDALAGINGKASDTIEELTEKLVEQTEALRESVQANISSVSELNQVADTLSKGQSLSASAVAELILKYPELASQIRKTTDGWTFEGQVLEKLRQAKIKKAIDDLKAERDSTRAVALESLKRIQFYGQEFQSITTFAEAREKIKDIEKEITEEQKKNASELNSTQLMNQGIANFLQQKANEQLDAKKQRLNELKDVIKQYSNQLQLSNDQIEAMTKLLEDDTYGVEDNNKARKETVEIMTDLQKAIEGYNKALEKLDSQQKRVAKSSKEYLDILAQKRAALLEEQKLYEQGYNDPSLLISSQSEITTGGGPSSSITSMLSNAINLANSGVMKYKQIPGNFNGSFDEFKQRAYSDCSQFVQEMFETIGVQLPRTAAEQAKSGLAVSKNNLQAGDLVFFNTTGKDNSHVGIYMGDSKFIQMGNSGLKVQDLNSNYWASKYNGATRVPGLSIEYPESTNISQAANNGVKYAGKYAAEVNAAASKFNIDPFLIAAVMERESSSGATGIKNVMQVNGMNSATPEQSINAGAKILAELLKKSGGDVRMALGGYNMGAGIIDWFKKSGGYNQADMVAYSEKYKKVYNSKVYGDVGYVDKVMATYAPQKTTPPTQKQLTDSKNTAEKELLRISDELYNIDVSELESKLGIKDMKIADKELALKQSEARQKNMKKDTKEYKAEYELQLKLNTEIQALMQEQRQMIEQSGLKSDELINKRRSLTEKIGDIQSEKEDMKNQFASDQFDTAKENMEARVERMRQQGRSEMEMTKTQLQFFQGQLKNTALTEEQRVVSAKQVYDLTNKVTELKFKNSTNWIDKQTEQMERQGKSEVEIYQMQAEAYNRMRNDTTLKAEQRAEAEKMYQDTSKKLIASRYEFSEKWMTKEAMKMEMAGGQKVDIMQWELQEYLKMQADKTLSTEQLWDLEQKIYKQRNDLDKEYYSAAEKRINHLKAIGEMTTEQELTEYMKLQASYLVGSELRMDADEKVYDLKKKLMDEMTKAVSESVTRQKKLLDNARDEEIKRIQAEKDAFTTAQEAKIKAIDDLIQAMERNNDQDDYERQRAEKVARLELLQSAVGPEGIAERKQVQKDIEDLDREHGRKLARQALEDQKTASQEEKTTREKDFDDKIQSAKSHYDDLSAAFDEFSSNTELSAENLKNIQILKESEKNETILGMLDAFILEYQSRLDKIASASAVVGGIDVSGGALAPGTALKDPSYQKDIDLYTYNANKDAWDLAKARGDAATMKLLQEQNDAIRKKYGIDKDTGKLQHFSEGGVVKGPRGAAVPVIAHGGEIFLNDRQQDSLFKLLNLRMHNLTFSMPEFSVPDASYGVNSERSGNHIEINSGDTYIADESVARVFWSERDNLVRRMQARGGKG
ncbi:NlpC/P60 family protein [Paenibacillus silvae]|uniref:Transglycosylase n=1 Tax=Paenibacillus silvae TaxID=1325358 RepID=A0A2W6QA20_9BACL|nr:NlpC/P60 family protein [Paenibacillus silvae]PZT54133.1 transglycosylase [Paenibacillus silvae]